MALDPNALAQTLSAQLDANDPAFGGFSPSRTTNAARFCAAYDSYCRGAVDPSGDALISANLAAMVATLQSGWAGVADAGAAAQAFAAAASLYWAGATFALGKLAPPGSGAVGGNGLFSLELNSLAAPLAPAPLQAALAAEFARNNAGPGKIQGLAQAMHAGTFGVVVVTITGLDSTPPPAGPLPCTLVGTVK